MEHTEVVYGEMKRKLPNIAAYLVNLRATWDSVPRELRPRFTRLLMLVGFVAGEIRTANLGLLFSLSETSDDSDSSEVALTGARLNQLAEEIQAFADLFRDMEEAKQGTDDAVQKLPAGVPKVEIFEPDVTRANHQPPCG
jgi:hypothetical protein